MCSGSFYSGVTLTKGQHKSLTAKSNMKDFVYAVMVCCGLEKSSARTLSLARLQMRLRIPKKLNLNLTQKKFKVYVVRFIIIRSFKYI